MYPHRIRLRGPWECEPLESANGIVPPPSRVTMPCHWRDSGLADFAGRVRYRRRFGYPGRIDDTERVWLTFVGASDAVDVTLNGVELGRVEQPSEPFEFAVTQLLRPRNELLVEVSGGAPTAGLWGEVALEIRRTAFLQRVSFEPHFAAETVHLHVAGEVAGSADGLLELYLLLDRSTIAYKTVTAGAAFEIVSDAIPLVQWRAHEAVPVKLDLVQGAIVWYSMEQAVTPDRGQT
jgi:hypothetical protein